MIWSLPCSSMGVRLLQCSRNTPTIVIKQNLHDATWYMCTRLGMLQRQDIFFRHSDIESNLVNTNKEEVIIATWMFCWFERANWCVL
jgi:hypothetical protein